MDIAFRNLRAPRLFSLEGQRDAAWALAFALVAGVVTQALFWRAHAGMGLNFFVWDLLAVAANVVVFRQGPLRPTAWGAITACVLLGFSIVCYASDWSL